MADLQEVRGATGGAQPMAKPGFAPSVPSIKSDFQDRGSCLIINPGANSVAAREVVMCHFELHTIEPGTGQRTGSIGFNAEDVAEALTVAHKLAGDRRVELWQDDRRLCAIQRSRREPEVPAFWMVS